MPPEITIDHEFNWLPPLVGTPVNYRVACDNPSCRSATPGTVVVPAPSTKIAMSSFLSGQPAAAGYVVYVAAEDAAGNVSGVLSQPFTLTVIGTPQPAPEPFTLPA